MCTHINRKSYSISSRLYQIKEALNECLDIKRNSTLFSLHGLFLLSICFSPINSFPAFKFNLLFLFKKGPLRPTWRQSLFFFRKRPDPEVGNVTTREMDLEMAKSHRNSRRRWNQRPRVGMKIVEPGVGSKD